MKLTELDPRWILRDGKRIGFTFISPAGGGDGRRVYRQSCFCDPPPSRDQLKLFAEMHGDDAIVQGCNPAAHWTIDGGIASADFVILTVKPSLDGSPGGLWHGVITNGEIK